MEDIFNSFFFVRDICIIHMGRRFWCSEVDNFFYTSKCPLKCSHFWDSYHFQTLWTYSRLIKKSNKFSYLLKKMNAEAWMGTCSLYFLFKRLQLPSRRGGQCQSSFLAFLIYFHVGNTHYMIDYCKPLGVVTELGNCLIKYVFFFLISVRSLEMLTMILKDYLLDKSRCHPYPRFLYSSISMSIFRG